MPADAQLKEQFFRSAAFLRREFLGLLRLGKDALAESQVIAQRREKTIFVFDTDVIATACEPWSEKAGRYGAIFPSPSDRQTTEPPEWQKRTGSLIASYALERVRAQSLPIYQLGPHFDETQEIFEKNARYFAGLARARMPLTEAVDRERLRRAAALFRHNVHEEGRGAQLLPSLTSMLQALTPLNLPSTLNEQRLQAWERFVKLNSRTGGIYPAVRASGHLRNLGKHDVADLLEIFDEDNGALTSQERDLFIRVSDVMERRIEHFVSDSRGRANNRRDAEAIARLYLANARLSAPEVQTRIGPWRVVFVTGSKAVTEACYADPKPGAERTVELSRVPGTDQAITREFSQKFVRHIWAYTTEALLDPGREVRFKGWLDGLLGAEAEATDFSETHLTSIVRDGIADGTPRAENIIDDDLEYWEKAVQAAVTRDQFSQLGLDYEEARKLQQRIIANFKFQSFESLEKEVDEQFHRAKDRSFVELSETGAIAIVKSSEFGERNPPDLAFGTLEHTNHIFKRLSDVNGYTAEAFHNDLEKIRKDCHEPDLENPEDDGDDRQRNHLKFLVIGAAFAAANKWGVALSQGERAVAIIERAKRSRLPIKVRIDAAGHPQTHMSGRESYFLCASAQRISAAREWEFDRARDFLKKADEALTLDRDLRFAKRTTRVRFWGEQLAISLGQYYFARWRAESSKDAIDDSRFCDTIASKVFIDLSTLMSSIELEGRLGAPFCDSRANFRGLGRITIANMAVNIVQSCVIRAYRRMRDRSENAPFAPTAADLRQALQLISAMIDPPKGSDWKPIRETALIDAYRSVGYLLLGENEPSVSRRRVRAASQLKYVASYDPWRFEQLEMFRNEISEKEPEVRRRLAFQ
jgi:hypothetical protein